VTATDWIFLATSSTLVALVLFFAVQAARWRRLYVASLRMWAADKLLRHLQDAERETARRYTSRN
jgi:hypothetical protein